MDPALAKPPTGTRRYTECFGFTLEDLGEAGVRSIEQRLRAIGLPVDTIPALPAADGPPAARARRARAEAAARRAHRPGRRPACPGPRGDRDHVRHDPPRQAIPERVRPGTDDRVGLRRRRAVARACWTTAPRGRRPGRAAARPHPARRASTTGPTSWPGRADPDAAAAVRPKGSRGVLRCRRSSTRRPRGARGPQSIIEERPRACVNGGLRAGLEFRGFAQSPDPPHAAPHAVTARPTQPRLPQALDHGRRIDEAVPAQVQPLERRQPGEPRGQRHDPVLARSSTQLVQPRTRRAASAIRSRPAGRKLRSARMPAIAAGSARSALPCRHSSSSASSSPIQSGSVSMRLASAPT